MRLRTVFSKYHGLCYELVNEGLAAVASNWVTMKVALGNWRWEFATAENTHPANTVHRSIADRFAIPHDFPPDLTLKEALVRVVGALVRICLGSLLFALWGVGSALAWGAILNPFLRVAALVPLLLLFLLALTGLMVGVTAAVKKISPKPSS